MNKWKQVVLTAPIQGDQNNKEFLRLVKKGIMLTIIIEKNLF